MDTAAPPEVRLRPHLAEDARFEAKRTEHLVDALKTAVELSGEHRLFRWGKLGGLFPSRVAACGAAATSAVNDGLLEITRTEARGKLIVEWVRATPAAVAWLQEHDSPKAVLRELRSVLAATRTAVPDWMEQARDEAAQLATRFEHRAREILEKLDRLSESIDAALRRSETHRPRLGSTMANLVPWGVAALEYLDRRGETMTADCPLPDLFRAMEVRFPEMTVATFQDGLKRLKDANAVVLIPVSPSDMLEPEYAFVIDQQLIGRVRR